jgi:hypothetical protein
MTGLVATFRARLARLVDQLDQGNRFELVLLLTILTVLLYHNRHWYLSGPITVLMGAALVWPSARTSALYWAAALALLSLAGVRTWYTLDNHQYLFMYWCLAVSLALLVEAEERDRCLARSASLLLGASMLLAAGQKIMSPSYVSGAFFEYTLLCDWRFESIAWAVGRVPLDHLEENRRLVHSLTYGGAVVPGPSTVILLGADQVRLLARAMTWFAVVSESVLAVLFLVPSENVRWRVAASIVLFVFLVTVYPVAPVVGFGWILITMALAQLPPGCRRLRVAFVCLFVALPIVTVPPARVLSVLDRVMGG